MKKLITFDLDGTLTPSKSPAPDRIVELLGLLVDRYEVLIMSGGKYEQFQDQLLAYLKLDYASLSKLHIMPTCGTRYYRFDPGTEQWQQVYAENFEPSQKDKIIKAIKRVVSSEGLDQVKAYGEQIEDRGSQISWSALGQDIVDVLGEEGLKLKTAWDPDGRKKEKLRSLIAPLLPEFEVRVGGSTTVDITKLGIDKAYGIQKIMNYLKLQRDEILFIGDRLEEGGNDYPVKAMGIDCLQVDDWQATAFVLQAILFVS